jgi:hypothetical protein
MRAATLNGIEVHEWTTANIQQLLKTSERQNNRPVALLFGIAFCINVLVTVFQGFCRFMPRQEFKCPL